MKEEVIEGNKLIAEFMLYDYSMYNKWIDDEDSVMERQIEVPLTEDDLEYHNSWDWLMPVVEKIDKEVPDSERKQMYQGVISYEAPYANIKNIWLATVDFIKWYNQHSNI